MSQHSIGKKDGRGWILKPQLAATSLASVVNNTVQNTLMVNTDANTNAICPTISKDLFNTWLNNVLGLIRQMECSVY